MGMCKVYVLPDTVTTPILSFLKNKIGKFHRDLLLQRKGLSDPRRADEGILNSCNKNRPRDDDTSMSILINFECNRFDITEFTQNKN